MPSLEEEHGWTAVSRSLDKLLADRPNKTVSSPIQVEDIPLPDSTLIRAVQAYARQHLSIETYNHSMRVYYYARAITLQHFPTWLYNPSTLLLASLLHDIGTTPHNQASTRFSFEFQGGYLALDLLKSLRAELAQAEAVTETVIRHQDLGSAGMVTQLTAIVHFATVLDNAGLHAELVALDTIRSVVQAFPRRGWTGCFARVVRREVERKPWANTTRIEGFAEMVEGNGVMAEFDGVVL